MKVALYIEEGLEQIVLTPQNDHEKQILNALLQGRQMSIHQGAFYAKQAGHHFWMAHNEYRSDSTIIALRPRGSSDPCLLPGEDDGSS